MIFKSKQEFDAVQWTGKNWAALTTFLQEYAPTPVHIVHPDSEKPPLVWVERRNKWYRLDGRAVVVAEVTESNENYRNGVFVMPADMFEDDFEPSR